MNNVPFQTFNTDFNQLTLIGVTVKYTQTTWDQSGGVVRRPTSVSALNFIYIYGRLQPIYTVTVVFCSLISHFPSKDSVFVCLLYRLRLKEGHRPAKWYYLNKGEFDILRMKGAQLNVQLKVLKYATCALCCFILLLQGQIKNTFK